MKKNKGLLLYIIMFFILCLILSLIIFIINRSNSIKRDKEQITASATINNSNTTSSEDLLAIKETSIELGDIDGNGINEYVLITSSQIPDYQAHMCLFFNNEMIYEYDDILLFDPKSLEFIDLDQDENKEIFFSFTPHVNSLPLDEYIVLKKLDSGWMPLEIIHGETMLDNAFPIMMTYESSIQAIKITCTGTLDEVTFPYTEHYQQLIKQDEEYEMTTNLPYYNSLLDGSLHDEGAVFGSVAPWGIWNIESGMFEDTPCLIANHGLFGDNAEYFGDLDIYFNYTTEGLIQILDLVFTENKG